MRAGRPEISQRDEDVAHCDIRTIENRVAQYVDVVSPSKRRLFRRTSRIWSGRLSQP